MLRPDLNESVLARRFEVCKVYGLQHNNALRIYSVAATAETSLNGTDIGDKAFPH